MTTTRDKGNASPAAIRKAIKESRERFLKARKATKTYERLLKGVARQVGNIVRGVTLDGELDQSDVSTLDSLLREYARIIRPWAFKAAAQMVAEVGQRDEKAWVALGREMGQSLRREIETAPTGEAMRELLNEQVGLIQSIPLKAAKRVHHLTTEGITKGTRASETAREIMKTGKVSESRAKLIARTETARTASILNQVRAEHIGSKGYIWRTTGDSDVREIHKKLNGKYIAWDNPPIAADDGTRAHAGQIYNCFTGDTPVSLSNGCKTIFRMPYSGDLIDFFVEGVKFSVTPNHPILTQRGWVAAGDITNSDYLVQAIDDAGVKVKAYKNNANATFEQVFSTLAFRAKSNFPFLFNFYGDTPTGNVDTIATDDLLSVDIITKRRKGISDFALSNSDCWILYFVIASRYLHILKSSLSRFRDSIHSMLFAKAIKANGVSLTDCPENDVMPDKDFPDSPPGASMFFSKGRNPKTGNVSGDNLKLRQISSLIALGRGSMWDSNSSSPEFLAKNVIANSNNASGVFYCGTRQYKFLRIVDKAIRNFSGHVYTLESDNGWYSVTDIGIISKNCRCYADTILPEIE